MKGLCFFEETTEPYQVIRFLSRLLVANICKNNCYLQIKFKQKCDFIDKIRVKSLSCSFLTPDKKEKSNPEELD